jgi:signal transduction histidine kinase
MIEFIEANWVGIVVTVGVAIIIATMYWLDASSFREGRKLGQSEGREVAKKAAKQMEEELLRMARELLKDANL